MAADACFHTDSGAVCVWVPIADGLMGASIGRSVLHHRFRPGARDDDPLQTFLSHRPEIEAAVRRRAAQGSIEPVMVREYHLRADTGDAGDAGQRPG